MDDALVTHQQPGDGGVAVILRAESVALFLGGIGLWLAMNGHPLWLLPLLLAPDLSMLGYLAGPRLGAITYNAVHNIVVAALLLGVGSAASIAPVALAGAVILAHVGMDRTLGYGLKLPTDFKDTHLGHIGRG
jgi:hypothetical protein